MRGMTMPWRDPLAAMPDWMPERARRPATAADRRFRSAAIEASAEVIARARGWLDGIAGPEFEDLQPRLFDRGGRADLVRSHIAAVIGLQVAVTLDERMTREAWRLLWRRLGRVKSLEALTFAATGLRREPLIEAGAQRVLPLIAGFAVVDLVGWRDGSPDDWSTRTRAWPALVGRELEGDAAALRLCRTPASWWRAGGSASAALCLLDATDGHWPCAIERAAHLTCDDEDHAAAVERWLKPRRPKLPKLWIASGGEAG